MDQIKSAIFNYVEYLQTPSLSHFEEKFSSKVEKDFGTENCVGNPLALDAPLTPYMFIVHLDRVKVIYSPPTVLNDWNGENVLTGQLDNAITIGCLKSLKDEGFKFNVFFTKREEICDAHNEVINMWEALDKKYTLIDCDIDVYFESDEWRNSISLRDGDDIEAFDTATVSDLREKAYDGGIPVDVKTDWLIGTAGFVMREGNKKGYNIPAAYLGLPILEYHTNHEKVSIKSLKHYYNMLKLLCEGKNNE